MAVDDLERALLDHLVVEFADYGRTAVEFLLSGQALVAAPPAGTPRAANMVAYCLRTAMLAVLDSQDVAGGGQWRTRSRAVVQARKRFELTRNLPGEDSGTALRDLLDRIDEMEAYSRLGSVHLSGVLT